MPQEKVDLNMALNSNIMNDERSFFAILIIKKGFMSSIDNVNF